MLRILISLFLNDVYNSRELSNSIGWSMSKMILESLTLTN